MSGGDVYGDVLCNTSANYNPYILYRGSDNRIQAYYYSTNTSSWYHIWITPSSAPKVSTKQGSINFSLYNGQVAYIGQDAQLHYCFGNTFVDPNEGNWVVNDIRNTNGWGAGAAGDIVFEPSSSGAICYKGNDDRIQYYYLDGTTYRHAWTDNDFSTSAPLARQISQKPKSLAMHGNIFYYIGKADDKIHRYAYNGNTNSWDHTLLPNASYLYDQTGYPMADRAKGGIECNTEGNRISYLGYDGRIQTMYLDANGWHHGWIDDHFNTGEFRAFDSNLSSKYSSIAIGDLKAFYCGADSHLRYFNYEPCAIASDNTICNQGETLSTLHRVGKPTSPTGASATLQSGQIADVQQLVIYPNPMVGTTTIILPDSFKAATSSYTLYSALGAIVEQGVFSTKQSSINLAGYQSGVYLLLVKNGGQVRQSKVFKN